MIFPADSMLSKVGLPSIVTSVATSQSASSDPLESLSPGAPLLHAASAKAASASAAWAGDQARCAKADSYRHTLAAVARFSDSARP